MNAQLPSWLIVLARILFVGYFVSMGMSHLFAFQTHSDHLARKDVPLPRIATVVTVLMMVGGGLLVLFHPRGWIGPALLFGIIFPAPFYLHRFWKETEWYMRLSEFAHFMKDLSLAGAALLLISGPLSL